MSSAYKSRKSLSIPLSIPSAPLRIYSLSIWFKYIEKSMGDKHFPCLAPNNRWNYYLHDHQTLLLTLNLNKLTWLHLTFVHKRQSPQVIPQKVMNNVVKCFWKSTNAANNLLLLLMQCEIRPWKIKKNIVSRANAFSKTCMCFNINIIIFSPINQPIFKNRSEQFTNNTEQRYVSIIFHVFDVPFFENRNDEPLTTKAFGGPSRNNDIKQFM